jgi:hypothetical protein
MMSIHIQSAASRYVYQCHCPVYVYHVSNAFSSCSVDEIGYYECDVVVVVVVVVVVLVVVVVVVAAVVVVVVVGGTSSRCGSKCSNSSRSSRQYSHSLVLTRSVSIVSF